MLFVLCSSRGARSRNFPLTWHSLRGLWGIGPEGCAVAAWICDRAGRRSGSFADHLDQNLARAGAVELAEEDPLPRSQHQGPSTIGIACDDEERRARAEVGVAVWVRACVGLDPFGTDFEVVVAVVAAVGGSELCEQVGEVSDETAFSCSLITIAQVVCGE